ncbi:MAG: YihY/virulence factor BrkB family protein [Archangiaceae bacterium]|nr:YihY/virulence factor BrkB family protein [Archangiaceae bacterium]
MSWSDTRLGRFFADTVRATRGLVHSFRGESIALRAGNLTFITITSLIPLVGVALALLQFFKQRELEALLKGFVRDLLQPGVREASDQLVNTFVSSAGSRITGGLSFAILLFSAGLLLRHLDASLNEVWAVTRRRPILVSVGLYAGLLLVGPLVIAATLAGTRGIRTLIEALNLPYSAQVLVLGSTVAAMVSLTLLYKLAPHAPVRWRSAAAGGLLAGVAWDVARHSYSGIATLAFSANPVYGSLGIAPLFLMWLYVSWSVVLFGARLAYAVEHAGFRGSFMDILAHPRVRELIAARVAQIAARAFLSNAPAPTSRQVAALLSVPAQTVDEVVHRLELAGLLKVEKKGELKPSRDPSLLTLADVSTAVGGVVTAGENPAKGRAADFAEFEQLFKAVDNASVEKLSQISWTTIANGVPRG